MQHPRTQYHLGCFVFFQSRRSNMINRNMSAFFVATIRYGNNGRTGLKYSSQMLSGVLATSQRRRFRRSRSPVLPVIAVSSLSADAHELNNELHSLTELKCLNCRALSTEQTGHRSTMRAGSSGVDLGVPAERIWLHLLFSTDAHSLLSYSAQPHPSFCPQER